MTIKKMQWITTHVTCSVEQQHALRVLCVSQNTVTCGPFVFLIKYCTVNLWNHPPYRFSQWVISLVCSIKTFTIDLAPNMWIMCIKPKLITTQICRLHHQLQQNCCNFYTTLVYLHLVKLQCCSLYETPTWWWWHHLCDSNKETTIHISLKPCKVSLNV